MPGSSVRGSGQWGVACRRSLGVSIYKEKSGRREREHFFFPFFFFNYWSLVVVKFRSNFLAAMTPIESMLNFIAFVVEIV